MRHLKTVFLLFVLMFGASSPTWAWHRVHVGIGIGVPIWGPGYYPPYYYPPAYYPPAYPVVVQQPIVTQPPVYVQQEPAPVATPAPGADNYWYYCAKSKTYYPYVKSCPGGWERVMPQPNQ